MPQNSRKGGSKSNNYVYGSNMYNKQTDAEKTQVTLNQTADVHYTIKHAHIPSIPSSNMVLFHFIVLIFSLTATMMQYLHIYRTVWWLPHSHAKNALNFYLIDPHLFGYLIAIEIVPFLYSLYKQILQIQNRKIWFLLSFTFCMIICAIWFLAFIIFSFCVYMKTTGFYLLILFYPPIAYALIYCHYLPSRLFKSFKSWFCHIKPSKSNNDSTNENVSNNSMANSNIQASTNEQNSSNSAGIHNGTNNIKYGNTTPSSSPTSTFIPTSATSSSSSSSTPSATQLALEQYGIFYYSKSVRHSSGSVQHTCTMNPEEIREEVERLKSDFNRKFRDIFFGTLFTFFYASLVPLLFVPKPVMKANGKINAVHYDGVWCGQHVFVTAGTAFLLYSVQHLSPAYVDVLHRCALHLGRWRREEGRSANVPYNPWSQLQTFPRGTLVKHVRGLFRAVGVHNSAEPGNNMHNRFFCFFYPALRLANVMCVLVFGLLAIQYALLIQNYEWYKIISVSSMMFFNVFSLYKILRNRFLLSRCYKEENATSSPTTPSNTNVHNNSTSTQSHPTNGSGISGYHGNSCNQGSSCTIHTVHHYHHHHHPHQFSSGTTTNTSNTINTVPGGGGSPPSIVTSPGRSHDYLHSHNAEHLHVD